MWRHLLDKFGGRANVYNGIQRMVGSERVWNGFIHCCQTTIEDWIPSESWLDLGCGTAEVLDRLPVNIPYIGVDSSPEYIAFAKNKYKERSNTTFVCANWNDTSWHSLLHSEVIRVVSLLGLLHHLNSDEAQNVLQLSFKVVKHHGTIITLDGCKEASASKIERFFYWIDRGQFIRNSDELQRLFPTQPTISLYNNWLRVPYCYAVCQVHNS